MDYNVSQVKAEIPNDSKSVYSVLLRHRWFILGSAAMVAGICTILALVIPCQYESVAQLMPPSENATSSAATAAGERAASLIGLPLNVLGGGGQGALFVKILSSRSTEDAVIARFDLQKVYGVRYLQEARKELEGNTKVVLDRDSGVTMISVRDKNPGRARAMCQEYVDELNLLSNQLSTSSARRERLFLEGRLKVIKAEMDQSAASLGQFSSKNNTVDISQEGKAMVEAVAALQGQLVSAEAELDGLRKVYGKDNVRVTAAEARVSELKRSLQAQAGQKLNPLTESGLPYPSIRELPLIGVTYSSLLQRTEIDAAVYQQLSQAYEIARDQEAKDIPSVRLLDPPNYPERPVPGRMLFIEFGGFLGLVLSGLWVYLKEFHPEKLRTGPAAQTYDALRSDIGAAVNLVRRRKWRR